MAPDARYAAIKILIETGHISSFKQLFTYIPKSVLGADLGLNNTRITRLISYPDRFSIRDINGIATVINIDPLRIVQLIYSQIRTDQSAGKQKKSKVLKKN
jgi:hypothetical protein